MVGYPVVGVAGAKAFHPASPGGEYWTNDEARSSDRTFLANAPYMALAPYTVIGTGGQLLRVAPVNPSMVR